MTRPSETAFPVLEPDPSPGTLAKSFSPDKEEIAFAKSLTGNPATRLCALAQLKLLRHLNRFANLHEIPRNVLEYISNAAGLGPVPALKELRTYDRSTTSRRHRARLRTFCRLRETNDATLEWLTTISERAAEERHLLADIINIEVEELHRHGREFPPFATLDRIAAEARNTVHSRHLDRVAAMLTPEMRGYIDDLLRVDKGATTTPWNSLKRQPKAPTHQEMRLYLQHVARLRHFASHLPVIELPVALAAHLRDVARTLDAGELAELKPTKRYALAAIFIRAQYSAAMDDVADIFIRRFSALENSAQRALAAHNTDHQGRSEMLVQQLQYLLEAFVLEASDRTRLQAMEQTLIATAPALIEQCREHLAHAGGNYLPFLLRPYAQTRPLFFTALEAMQLRSASEDTTMEKLIAVILEGRTRRVDVIDPVDAGIEVRRDLHWMSTQWSKLVLRQPTADQPRTLIDRRYLELAVISQVKSELKTGDLYMPDATTYDDIRDRLVTDQELDNELPAFSKEAGVPADAKELIDGLKKQLSDVSLRVDAAFPDNEHAEIVNGLVVLTRLKKRPDIVGVDLLDRTLSERMAQTTIVDALIETVQWTGIEKYFKPLAGTEPKVDDVRRRVVTTLFCYGCNLGATQTSRSIRDFSRRQVSWLNLKYVTEDSLQRMNTDVINVYKKFDLVAHWGAGKRASADGKHWSLLEQTLTSEHHLRYGAPGGIGYYFVSDTYILLFSKFITCGAYEGHYILDGIMANSSDIRPDTVHGDTHQQNYCAFGIAHLLGVKLMPRIRRLKDLSLFRPDRKHKYQHIEPLFVRTPVDWDLIARHWRDLLRIAVSIKRGKVAPSTVLRRFSNENRKNKIVFAAVELGKVIRTLFLLEYIDDVKLRRVIQAVTNQSEQANAFLKWAFFGNDGVIGDDVRHQQQKLIKYNQLVANLLILHNVQEMSRAIGVLREEGMEITSEMLGALGPYRTGHINRFGDYYLDITRTVPPLKFVLRGFKRPDEDDTAE